MRIKPSIRRTNLLDVVKPRAALWLAGLQIFLIAG